MAKKKDFSNMMDENPAMAFISKQKPKSAYEASQQKKENSRTVKATLTPVEQEARTIAVNPVPAEQEAPPKIGTRGDLLRAPEGYRIDPRFIEMKTRRVQLVFQPSVYAAGKEEADRLGVSFNDYVHALIRADRGLVNEI